MHAECPLRPDRCSVMCLRSELQELVDYRDKYFHDPGLEPPKILALGLSSRKNLCVHPRVQGVCATFRESNWQHRVHGPAPHANETRP